MQSELFRRCGFNGNAAATATAAGAVTETFCFIHIIGHAEVSRCTFNEFYAMTVFGARCFAAFAFGAFAIFGM